MSDYTPYEITLKEKFPSLCRDIYCGAHISDHWKPPVEKALTQLQKFPIHIAQIKQKFCALRIYFDHNEITTEEFDNAEAIIAEAVQACRLICEVCGKPAEPRNGWGLNTCSKCEQNN